MRRPGVAVLVLAGAVGAAMAQGRTHAETDPAPERRDRDGDGVADGQDRCVLRAGLPPDGCPPRDSDGDGLLDGADACPGAPGPAENRGCPDRDRDGDRVVDRRDICADVAGDPRFGGCVMPDGDGDGIADPYDLCRERAEVWNGRGDDDGCPDRGRAVIVLHAGRAAVAPGRLARSSGALTRRGRAAVSVAAELSRAKGARRVRVVAIPGRGPARTAPRRAREARALADRFARALATHTFRIAISVAQTDRTDHSGRKRPRIELFFD